MTNLEAMKIGVKGLSEAMRLLKEYQDKTRCDIVTNAYVQPLAHINNAIAKITSKIKDADYYNQEIKKMTSRNIQNSVRWRGEK